MRIIVEGPDGAGKSTLIRALHAHFENLVDVRNDKEDKQDFSTWWDEQLIARHDGLVPVHDRFFYSELVYGPVIRGHISVPQYVTDEIRAHLRHTALLVYARPQFWRIRDNLKINDQMKGVKRRIIDLTAMYDSLFLMEAMHYGRRFYKYDYADAAEPAALMEIVRGYLTGEVT